VSNGGSDTIPGCYSRSSSRVLITTDVWARGIDVQQVSLVINYDLPACVLCPIVLFCAYYGIQEP
jgi:hypothetical protein